MADRSTLALAASRRLRDALAGDRLPRATAQLYSQHVRLQAGGEPLSAFGPADARRQLWDAVRLVDAARYARRRGDGEWRVGLRRAGELFEWLANPSSNPEGLPLQLLGAAAYHIAGYPARAASLARNSPDDGDIPLLRHLLSGDLNSLLILCSELSAQPAVSSAPAVLSSDAALELVVRQITSSLGVVAASLRWEPDERLSEALEILELTPSAAMHLADPFAWLLLRLTADSAAIVAATSLRTALDPLSRALGDEARAAVEQYSRAAFQNRQALVWPSQQRGIDMLVEGGSFALCTPTGSGKTRIAEIALLQGLLEREGDEAPLCLYIVPTRALAAEVEGKLARALREIQSARAVTVTRLYGGIDWSPTDEWLADDEPTVLICTQEKAEALVRFFGRLLSNRLRVVIVDEAHAVQFSGRVAELESHESRSLRLEMLISRLKALRPDARFIAISAVARRLAQPLGRWISADSQPEAITVPYRSTRQVVGRLQLFANGDSRIVYDLLDGNPVTVGRDAEPPFVPTPFPRMPSAPDFEGVMKRSAAAALWAAANSVAASDGDADGQSVLVSIAEQIGNHASWWLTLIEDVWPEELPPFFAPPEDPDDRAAYATALASCSDLFEERSREFRLLKHGVALHHGRMPVSVPAQY
jgi:hypothetical protein